MPRRSRRDAVAERANQILEEQTERRRLSAQVAAGTRQQRRAQRESEAQPQPATESPTQAPTTRRSRPRVHGQMLTVAIRGPLAEKMRELAESSGMSLSKLLQDAILLYEQELRNGYQFGTSISQWSNEQAR